ncbi:hypothetical protein N0B44_16285 [Roseibacterium beibuensis]|uniref:hypothetical protein n=1 Tax=[Roseibacterium] beibuensis TaxID=1193142 RepID=UPI00217D7B4A|nr:hypothetical protein [Roseibacterium beibuensis]MCS6624478.1 hypothetical protein [Roseibacterium beibuensis]
MRSMIAAAGVLILLGACAPEPEGPLETAGTEVPTGAQDAPAGPTTEPPSAQAQADCKARKGEMQRVGMLGTWQCIVRYADAGKPCTDGDQCEGECRAEVDLPPPPSGPPSPPAKTTPPPAPTAGVCQADSNHFGCYAVIENGRAQPMICVD